MKRQFAICLPTAALALFAAVSPLASGPPVSAADGARRGAEYFTNVELTTQFGTRVRF